MTNISIRTGSSLTALLVAAGALWFGACGGDAGTEPPPESDAATIEVTVTADGSGQAEVTVRLFASGGESAVATRQTTASGVAAFEDLTPGTYEAEIDIPAGLELDEGEGTRKSVSASAGATAAVAFRLVSRGEDPGGEVVEIHLTSDNQFSPSSVTISPGTTIRWINDIARFHTITPSGHSQWTRQEMNDQGQTFEQVFQAAGTFNYFCEPHESIGMTGSITVE